MDSGASAEAPVASASATLADAVRSGQSEYERFAAAAGLARLGPAAVVAETLGDFLLPETRAEAFARHVLVSRLVSLDPATAIEMARTHSRLGSPVASKLRSAFGIPRSERLLSALLECQEISPIRTLALVRALADGEAGAVVEALGQADPSSLHTYRVAYFRDLAATDLQAALRGLREIEDEDLRAEAGRFVLLEHAEASPAEAFDLALEIGNPRHKGFASLQFRLLRDWFQRDFAAARERVFAPDFPLAHHTLEAVANALAADDPAAAREWVSTKIQNSRLRDDAVFSIARALAYHSPAEGVAFLADPPRMDDGQLNRVAAEFFIAWVKNDSTEALAWVSGQPEGIRRAALPLYFARDGAWKDDPELAFALLETPALEDESRLHLVREAFPLARHDLPRYLSLLEQLPGGEVAAGVAEAAGELLRDGYYSEATMLFDVIDVTAGAAREQAAKSVEEFAKIDPVETARWVGDFTDSEMRVQGIRDLVNTWAGFDPEAAARFSERFPPGSPEAGAAAASMAGRTLARDPESALAWLDRVDDLGMRESFFAAHVTDLLALDPVRVDRLLKDASPELKAKFDAASALRRYLLGESGAR